MDQDVIYISDDERNADHRVHAPGSRLGRAHEARRRRAGGPPPADGDPVDRDPVRRRGTRSPR